MSSRSSDDAAALLLGFVFIMVLLYAALIATIIVIASLAVFVIGWYLTHLLLMSLDRAAAGDLTTEHGGLLLLLSGALWAGLAWLLVPAHWLHQLATLIPAVAGYPYLPALLGGILGLAWGMLVLFVADREVEADLLDLSGLYSLTDQQLETGEGDTADLLTKTIILGTDVDD